MLVTEGQSTERLEERELPHRAVDVTLQDTHCGRKVGGAYPCTNPC